MDLKDSNELIPRETGNLSSLDPIIDRNRETILVYPFRFRRQPLSRYQILILNLGFRKSWVSLLPFVVSEVLDTVENKRDQGNKEGQLGSFNTVPTWTYYYRIIRYVCKIVNTN